jgi:catechol 2,3-dioxygenase-like lactoylglutathione lyase family enzyme
MRCGHERLSQVIPRKRWEGDVHLEHVNMTVRDVEASAAFYGDLFAWQVRWKGQVGDGAPALHVGDDRQYLALFQATTEGAVPYDYASPGVNHFGVVVDDLDAARERLDDLGIAVHLVADYEPGRRLYFFDPDGHEVELVEYAPGR